MQTNVILDDRILLWLLIASLRRHWTFLAVRYVVNNRVEGRSNRRPGGLGMCNGLCYMSAGHASQHSTSVVVKPNEELLHSVALCVWPVHSCMSCQKLGFMIISLRCLQHGNSIAALALQSKNLHSRGWPGKPTWWIKIMWIVLFLLIYLRLRS